MPARASVVSGAGVKPAAGDSRFLVSCEHGGNRIPPRYRSLFLGHEALLASHRGHDPGALALARQLAEALGAPLFASTTSRLLVDLNRSPGHRARLSEFARGAPRHIREEIDARYYLPYRQRLERQVVAALAEPARVVHISSHSFTPVLDGRERQADVGFLYDPASPGETAFCRQWLAALHARAPGLRLRRNYPYTGRSDGLCAWLRQRYAEAGYRGIELEVNQRHVAAGGPPWRQLCADIVGALAQAIGRD